MRVENGWGEGIWKSSGLANRRNKPGMVAYKPGPEETTWETCSNRAPGPGPRDSDSVGLG